VSRSSNGGVDPRDDNDTDVVTGERPDRYVRDGSLETLPFDPTVREDTIGDSAWERARSRPRLFYSGVALALTLIASIIIGIFPFDPRLDNPILYAPFLILAYTVTIFNFGAKSEISRWQSDDKLVIKSEGRNGNGDVIVARGEADRVDQNSIVFYPVIGWRSKGFRANYLKLKHVGSSLARRLGRTGMKTDDRVGILLSDTYTEKTTSEDFGTVYVTTSRSLSPATSTKVDEAAIQADIPSYVDPEELDQLQQENQLLKEDRRTLEGRLTTVKDRLQDLEAKLREDTEYTTGELVQLVRELRSTDDKQPTVVNNQPSQDRGQFDPDDEQDNN